MTDRNTTLTDDEINYPNHVFWDLISGNSPYAFYLFQWVSYHSDDCKEWRLKMNHDVKSFDGRVEYNVWPNGSHCGSFKDSEVEFIRISKEQHGATWADPRQSKEEIKS